ncbi:helix-turn-helix transcriptional regulator [Pseudoxanthomonas mexicana]|uniref:helix-turn-helix transcriptional regulator n=1 Tax=Pseudoxanthomonas mexicana TaxID=128785 RepID=UPI00209C79E7|nr:hypothetical protein [Pseudoxanthomonas mexicana]MCP1582065.1 putative DNA-binding transcriptional regulator AlpA [Pseudoxanthomonas mexicana]
MSYQAITAASNGAAPRLNRLSQAMTFPRPDPGAGDWHLKPDVLERLEAIYRAIQQAPSLDQAIRLPELLAIVGVSKSTWYARLNANSPSYDPRAPKPFKLGASERSPSVWWRSAVMAYVTACADAQVER